MSPFASSRSVLLRSAHRAATLSSVGGARRGMVSSTAATTAQHEAVVNTRKIRVVALLGVTATAIDYKCTTYKNRATTTGVYALGSLS